MALNESTRIVILLLINSFFCLLELSVGFRVYSLALLADSVYVLNDIISLWVGLWALKGASRITDPLKYTFGWQRAETLGALVNGVFPAALCMSILLEAASRIFDPQEVFNPELVGVIGCCGLLSNLLCLFLLRGHSHSHGHQSERGADNASDAEKGHGLDGSTRCHLHARTVADEGWNGASWRSKITTRDSRSSNGRTREAEEWSDKSEMFVKGEDPVHRANSAPSISTRDQSSPISMRKSSPGKLNCHPRSSVSRPVVNLPFYRPLFGDEFLEKAIELPVLDPAAAIDSVDGEKKLTLMDEKHDHSRPKEVKRKWHNLNMGGIFLRVMDYAVGNLCVIGSALIIGLSSSPWRFYSDPVTALTIVFIIVKSAIPLFRKSSRILLQAVPVGMDVEGIKRKISGIEGILDCHHFHAWQLSNNKYVATLHILINTQGPADQMELLDKVQNIMSQSGVQSSTIQVEFPPREKKGLGSSGQDSESTTMRVLEHGDDGFDQQGKCCSPSSIGSDRRRQKPKRRV